MKRWSQRWVPYQWEPHGWMSAICWCVWINGPSRGWEVESGMVTNNNNNSTPRCLDWILNGPRLLYYEWMFCSYCIFKIVGGLFFWNTDRILSFYVPRFQKTDFGVVIIGKVQVTYFYVHMVSCTYKAVIRILKISFKLQLKLLGC